MDSRESDEVNFKWEEGESLNSFVELGKVSILIKTSRHRRKERWKISRILLCQLQSVEFKFVRTSGRGEHRELYIILLVNLGRVFFKTLIKVQLSLTQRNVNFQDGISGSI